MVVLNVAFLEDEGRQRCRAATQEFVECGGKRAEDVMSAEVEVDQGFTVQTVGQVGHVHAVQAAVSQLQTLQWRIKRAGEGEDIIQGWENRVLAYLT